LFGDNLNCYVSDASSQSETKLPRYSNWVVRFFCIYRLPFFTGIRPFWFKNQISLNGIAVKLPLYTMQIKAISLYLKYINICFYGIQLATNQYI